MVWDKAAMGTCGKPKALPHHASQNGMKPVLVTVGVVLNALYGGMDAHLAARDIDHRVD